MGRLEDAAIALLLLGALTVMASLLGDRERRREMCPSEDGCGRDAR